MKVNRWRPTVLPEKTAETAARLDFSREQPRAEVAPHAFRPMRRRFNRGRCSHCFFHEADHPIPNWVEARPYADKSKAVRY